MIKYPILRAHNQFSFHQEHSATRLILPSSPSLHPIWVFLVHLFKVTSRLYDNSAKFDEHNKKERRQKALNWGEFLYSHTEDINVGHACDYPFGAR